MEGSNKKNKISFFIPLNISPLITELKREEEEIFKKLLKTESTEHFKLLKALCLCLYKQRKCNNLECSYEYQETYLNKKGINCFIYSGTIFVVDDNLVIEREVAEKPCSIWIIYKDLLIAKIFPHFSIQDFGRLEQTSKEMRKFVEKYGWIKIIEKDVGFYNYFHNTQPKRYLKNLFTGKGYIRIPCRCDDDQITLSCDGKLVLFYDKVTCCSRIINTESGKYIYGFDDDDFSTNAIMLFRDNYILYCDTSYNLMLFNCITKKTYEILSNFDNSLQKSYLLNNTFYYLSNHDLVKYDLVNKQEIKRFTFTNAFKITFIEINDELLIRNRVNNFIYNSNFEKIDQILNNICKVKFKQKLDTAKVKYKNKTLYTITDLSYTIESTNALFVVKSDKIYRLY